MNSLIYKSGALRISPSVLALNEWHEKEKQALNCAVDEEGCLLDNLTLELRVHPPEVHIDNSGDPQCTLVTIDSANRPGSLVYVSCRNLPLLPQCFSNYFTMPHRVHLVFIGSTTFYGTGFTYQQRTHFKRWRLVP